MMKVTLKAFAKLNLSLDIIGTTEKGYHLIETVFQSVSLFDRISITTNHAELTVECGSSLGGKNNICFSAAEKFFEMAEISDAVLIEIEKNIPLSAGLAGGSADAAAVLRGLNYLYSYPLSDEKLSEIALSLGADVPFCLFGGTYLAGGIGEKLTRLADCPECDIILITEGNKPSTGELYSKMDSISQYERPNIPKLLDAIAASSLKGICREIKNVFCEAWDGSIEENKKYLLSLGALGAELSGSGPTVFGIFPKGIPDSLLPKISEKGSNVNLCHPIDIGWEIEKTE